MTKDAVWIPPTGLRGDLIIPDHAPGIVLFAHGSGSSRHSSRNVFVSNVLNQAGLGTLLFDLLTPEEEDEDQHTCHLRFNIPLLTERLLEATEWVTRQHPGFPIGYFGASTGAAAALVAAAERQDEVSVVVSRGGRPDLAAGALPRVEAATLLIVGENDIPIIPLNEGAFRLLHGEKRLAIVPGATHLFEEPGTLAQVASLAQDWFLAHLTHAVTT